MEKEFVPYSLALELKDLGFDEECFAWYNMSQDSLCFFGNDCCADMYAGEKSRPEAPLWQQAFDWLDIKFGLYASFDKIDNTRDFYYDFMIISSKNRDYDDESMIDSARRTLDKGKYGSYYEARLECLKKLIEIAKGQNVKQL